jgi:hypothetical protein
MLNRMEKAGTAVVQVLKEKGIKQPSSRDQKLIVAAAEVRNDPPSRAFLANQLVQCTLPHSDPGDVELWTRTNGNLTLGIRSGRDIESGELIGIPYGVIPRLVLFWINTEAVRGKTRRLELGSNLSRFMEALGLDASRGGVRSDATRLREQLRRLFRATISFQLKADRNGMRPWMDMRVALGGNDSGFHWWDTTNPRQSTLWTESVILSEEFYSAITDSPVPVNVRALKALRNSALLLDLYAWATHRAFVVHKRGEPQFFQWGDLMRQLGSEYADVRDFRKKALTALNRICQVYPGLRFEVDRGGLVVLPDSRPAIEG